MNTDDYPKSSGPIKSQAVIVFSITQDSEGVTTCYGNGEALGICEAMLDVIREILAQAAPHLLRSPNAAQQEDGA